MENRRAIIWSLAGAVIAALFYFLSVQKAVDNRVGDLDEKVMVYVAIREIPPFTRISPVESWARLQPFPRKYLPPRVAQNAAELIGQVPVAPIYENEPILLSKLQPFDEVDINRRIPDGYRAVTVGIRDDQDVVGVAGMLRPKNRVDILVTHFINTQAIEKADQGVTAQIFAQGQASLKAEVRTLFQNVEILAVGQDTAIPTAVVSRGDAKLQQTGRDLANKNVTVAMKPSDVQVLVLAQQTGRIMLALRPFNDAEIVDLDYTDPFKAFKIKLPVVQGPPPAYREVRGGQVFAGTY